MSDRVYRPGLRAAIFSGWALVWFSFLCAPWPVQAGAQCEICQAEFIKEYFIVEDSIRLVKKHVCEKCSKSKTVCSACHLAVNPKTMVKLEDGRILCEWDARGAILSQEQAGTIFNEVKREVQTMLSHWPPLPDRNITVHLVSRDQFVKEYRRNPGFDNPEKLLGLTRSSLDAETNHEHTIYLLNGVLKAQFMATCAHEYAHAWLREHGKRTRQLDKDTVEGFCELISYKFCALKNETNEIARLLASDYTHGQIHALIAAEEKYQFYRVISWVHEGEDSWLDKDELNRLLALKTEEAPVV
ncbi:MAG TPA: protein DA1, partial [Verrucomicrobiae bacterium]